MMHGQTNIKLYHQIEGLFDMDNNIDLV